MNDVNTKKHLNPSSKVILFVLFSAIYALPFVLAVVIEDISAKICIKHGLSYEHGLGGTIAIISLFAVFIIGIILLIITETKIYMKTDIPDGFFIFSPLALAFFYILIVNLIINFTDFFHDGELFLLYCLMLGIIKTIYDIIRLIKIKKYKLIPLCFLCLAGVFLCFLNPYLYEYYRSYIESIQRKPFI